MSNGPQKTCPQCGSVYDADQRFCPRDGSTLRAPPGSDLVGSVVADRYLILKRIGEGGMGQVYLAEHVKMKRKSAVKVMHQGMVHDQDAIQRFNREASNASSIQHPNVAAIYDFGETSDGLIYLAMEFIDGEPLTKIIERQGALPAARAAEITRQCSEALEAAHEMGIVHRDLKPDNIMIARGRAGEDVVKIVDFGIAKAMTGADQKVTKTGLAIGTPEYMSPEQLGGDALDSRTDIYSLGLVAFNMFTGQLPFPAVTSREALIMRLTEKPRTLADIRADVQWPEELQWVMDRALANHPGERYQHVSQFGRDLVKAVASMPQSALSQQGTIAISQMPSSDSAFAAGPTQARAYGGAAAAPAGATGTGAPASRRPTTAAPAGGTQEATTPIGGGARKSRAPLFIGLFILLAGAGGGGWWFLQQQQARSKATEGAALDSVARADSIAKARALTAVRDSAAKADSIARTAAADSAAKAAAAKGPKFAPLPSDAADALLEPIRDLIADGRKQTGDGEYERASLRFGNASDQIKELARKYPGMPGLKDVQKDLTAAQEESRNACKAERDDAIKRGETPPECP